MQPIINIGLAGFGYSAQIFHLPFLIQDHRFNIAKVFERRSDNAIHRLPNAQIVRNFNQLLTNDIDLVVITTPNQTHFELAKLAILANKHVLIEKPLATTEAEAQELIALANQHKVKVTVYQNRRWDNAICVAKQIINDNLLGEIVDCEIRFERYAKAKNVKRWKETGEKGTGLVYDLGVHLIDQAIYLFGKPVAIWADIRYQHREALSDDNFCIHLYYPSNMKVVLSATKYARESGNHFSLHGTLGSFIQSNVDPQEHLLSSGVMPVNDWYVLPQEKWGILHTEIAGEVIRKPYAPQVGSYQDFYDNLYTALTDNAPLAVTLAQAKEVLKLIELAFKSAKSGHKIYLTD